MNIFGRSIAVAVVALFSAIAGAYVHEIYPSEIAQTGDLIKSVSGLIGTLFAIVLGLLVSSSYTAFNSHQADFNLLASELANIDLLLKQFPVVSDAPRALLKDMVRRLLKRYWPEGNEANGGDVGYSHLTDDIDTILKINNVCETFENVTRDDLNLIRQYSSSFIKIQSNIVRSLSNQVPSLLLVIVFGWAWLLFFLYGSLSSCNIFSIFFLLLGAIAIASANFLILELTHPYQGIFKVSSAAFDMLLNAIFRSTEGNVCSNEAD
jgi:hypothetical protein